MARAVLTIVHGGVKSRSDRVQFHVQSAAALPGLACVGTQAGAGLSLRAEGQQRARGEKAPTEPPASGRGENGHRNGKRR